MKRAEIVSAVAKGNDLVVTYMIDGKKKIHVTKACLGNAPTRRERASRRIVSHEVVEVDPDAPTRRELARRHRKAERAHVSGVRYALRTKNYIEAFRHLAWALQQASCAEAHERKMENGEL